jgi:ubiquitin-associated SH3 domain-containing protein
MVELIVYACPSGELAQQLEDYFEQSQRLVGKNTAHSYMPHCTLTGFFHDIETAIPLYLQALDQTFIQAQPYPHPVVTITQMTFRSDWHGLELQSDWLQQRMTDFAKLAQSPTRSEDLRLKIWLHLSLAYEFQSEQADELAQLARQLINPKASVEWEVRFYQRYPDRTWSCHQSWLLK